MAPGNYANVGQVGNPLVLVHSGADANKMQKRLTQLTVYLLGFIALSAFVLGLASLVHPSAANAPAASLLNFAQASPQVTTTQTFDYTLVPGPFSAPVNLITAFIILSIFPFLLFLVYLSIKMNGGNFDDNHIWARDSGLDMLHALWAMFAEAPLFTFMLLWLGERSYETVFYTWIIVVFSGIVPSLVEHLHCNVKESSKPDSARNKTMKLMSKLVFLVLGLSVVFVWFIIFQRVAYGSRLTGADYFTTTRLPNWNIILYVSWWAAYRLVTVQGILGGGLTGTHNLRSYWLHFVNCLGYGYVYLTQALCVLLIAVANNNAN
jgi:hypothetical protein